MGRHLLRRGYAARLGFRARRFHLPRRFAFKVGPLLVADLNLGDMRLELWQRIARPFVLDLGLGLVGLRVLVAMTLKPRNAEAKQHRRPLRPDMMDRPVDQLRRFDRIGAVPVEDGQAGKAREVCGDVLPGSLVIRRHGNAVAIVLNVNEQRQLLRGSNS